MNQHVRVIAAAAVIAGCVPAYASAQSTVTDIVSFLVINRDVVTGDFERDRAAAEMARDTITRALVVNLATVPVATSSSGFLYRLNPQLGTVERATDSFGGFFIERALTPGRGRGSFGLSGSTSGFERLDDQNLRDGTLLTTANQFRDENAPFDTESLELHVRTSTLTAFASIGIGDRFEIGGALPFVRLTLEGERGRRPAGWLMRWFARSTRWCRRAPAVWRWPARCVCQPATRTTCSAPAPPASG
jgi:hypothetical protein